MDYRIAIYSSDAVFSRMLELEFSMRDLSVFCASRPGEGITAEIVLLDLDTAVPPRAETYRRMIGFTRNSAMIGEELRRRCSMILHRPFEMKLLRREVLFASADGGESTPLSADRRGFDALSHSAELREGRLLLDGKEIKLSANEAALMQLFLENRGKVLSREQLSEVIGVSGANKVEVYVCYLRRKLRTAVGVGLIETVRGEGYCIL